MGSYRFDRGHQAADAEHEETAPPSAPLSDDRPWIRNLIPTSALIREDHPAHISIFPCSCHRPTGPRTCPPPHPRTPRTGPAWSGPPSLGGHVLQPPPQQNALHPAKMVVVGVGPNTRLFLHSSSTARPNNKPHRPARPVPDQQRPDQPPAKDGSDILGAVDHNSDDAVGARAVEP